MRYYDDEKKQKQHSHSARWTTECLTNWNLKHA